MSDSMKKLAYIILAAGLVSSFVIMYSVSNQESAIVDEIAHIPAGYGYVKYFDYRLNPEHPPLVKMLAALPLTFLDLNFPTDKSSWQSDVNGQWTAGDQFIYQEGNNANILMKWARIGPILLTLILAFFIYWWSKELFGPWWALLPSLLFTFSPTVLAHGHYVTTDIGAALGVFISIYYFTKARIKPSTRNLVIAGMAFGIAQLLKFSAIILIPYFLLLVTIFLFTDVYRKWREPGNKLNKFFKESARQAKNLIIIFTVSLLVVYPLYSLSTINYPPEKQMSDTDFILTSFSGGKTPEGETCKPARCLADFNVWASDKPLLRPYAEYMLGILMVLQRSAGGNTGYFLGHVSAEGSHLYFPTVYVMKESLPVLLLILMALIISTWRMIKSGTNRFGDYLQTHPGEFAMLLFILLYAIYSIQSPLNIGVRHLLPIIPLIYILTTSSLRSWLKSNFFKIQIKIGVIALLLLWFTIEVAAAYPYYLSYFNQIGGGTANGWEYVTDSNYDWGQDMKRLKTFVDENNIDKIAIDYFGSSQAPKYYLGDKAEYWWSAKGDPRESGIKWLAVSVNTIQGSTQPWADENDPRKDEERYLWIKNPYQPYAKAGTSIFIYKFE